MELSWEIISKGLPNKGKLNKVKQVKALLDTKFSGPLFVFDKNKSDADCKTDSKKILTKLGFTWDTEV